MLPSSEVPAGEELRDGLRFCCQMEPSDLCRGKYFKALWKIRANSSDGSTEEEGRRWMSEMEGGRRVGGQVTFCFPRILLFGAVLALYPLQLYYSFQIAINWKEVCV